MNEHIKKCRKMLEFFRIFLNIHDFFDFFEVFNGETFEPNKTLEPKTRNFRNLRKIRNFRTQSCLGHHKILHKISRRTVHMRVIEPDWAKMVLYQKLSENLIKRGLKLRGLTQNQINLY